MKTGKEVKRGAPELWEEPGMKPCKPSGGGKKCFKKEGEFDRVTSFYRSNKMRTEISTLDLGTKWSLEILLNVVSKEASLE